MIKKQQKWIALLVTLTFVWLLQVSTMPMAAANAPEQIGSANTEQAPRFIEEEGDSGYQAKKKNILPIILIGVGVVAVAAVLFLVVFKSNYDIRGTWNATVIWEGNPTTDYPIVFTGDKKTGTLLAAGNTTGTYVVDGKNVTWNFDYSETVFTGTFTSKDSMKGTMTSPPDSGTFTATRTASAAGIGNSSPGGLGKKIK